MGMRMPRRTIGSVSFSRPSWMNKYLFGGIMNRVLDASAMSSSICTIRIVVYLVSRSVIMLSCVGSRC